MLFMFARKAMVSKKTTSSPFSSPFLTAEEWGHFNYKESSKSPYPYINYGLTPPPINPSFKIGNILIYSGSSTSGNDYITGQGYMNGYEGNDHIMGSARNDLIYGGAGNDVITSGGGNDYIDGGAGNDRIYLSNSGNSWVAGGAGNDIFTLSGSAGRGITKIMDYNPKEDRIDASQCGIGGLRSTNGTIEIIDLSGNSNVLLSNTGYKLTGDLKKDCFNLSISISQTTPAPKQETTALKALRFFQQGLVTKIYSGRSTNGNDVITGQGYIDGGEGDDKIIGSAGSDLIYGGAGNDVITSGRGRDYIFGGAGNDIIDLRNSGVSTADGGTGIDTFILGKGNGSAIQGYNPKEDRIDARECGIGDLRMQNGSIYIIAHGERGGSSIAWLEGISYQLTGNLKTDCQNLGITANKIGY